MSGFTTSDLVVLIVNMVMSTASTIILGYSSWRSPQPWRTVRALGGALAFIYTCGYVWVLATGDVLAWSSTMRGVSVLAWPTVWILPALVTNRMVKSMNKAIERAANCSLPSDDQE